MGHYFCRQSRSEWEREKKKKTVCCKALSGDGGPIHCCKQLASRLHSLTVFVSYRQRRVWRHTVSWVMSGFRRARAPAPADLAHHEYYIFTLPVHRGLSTVLAFFSPIILTRGLFYPCYIDVNLRLRSSHPQQLFSSRRFCLQYHMHALPWTYILSKLFIWL